MRPAGLSPARRALPRPHPDLRQRLVWRSEHARRNLPSVPAPRSSAAIARSSSTRSERPGKRSTTRLADRAVETVAAVRKAVGPRIGLMIEFHGRLAAGTASSMIRRLEPFDPAWCEEPVAPECLELLAEVKRSAPCPIAAGERLYTLADFYRLTALRAADVVQMDLAHCGGISAGKKIAAMAARAGHAGGAALLDRAGRAGGVPALRRQHAQFLDPGGVRRIRRPLAQRPGRRLEPDQERRARPGRRPGPGPRARPGRDRRPSVCRQRVPEPLGRRLADQLHPESVKRRTASDSRCSASHSPAIS